MHFIFSALAIIYDKFILTKVIQKLMKKSFKYVHWGKKNTSSQTIKQVENQLTILPDLIPLNWDVIMKVSIAEILLIILNANYNISELIVRVHNYSK